MPRMRGRRALSLTKEIYEQGRPGRIGRTRRSDSGRNRRGAHAPRSPTRNPV